YGVDTPTKLELIGAQKSIEQIRQFIGADSLGYLSLDSLRAAVEDNDGKFCTACYTGVYPTELVQLEVEAHRAC
ncbi:MAG TPA: amidophosphoribosyltransferase, partial [Candidatus Dormibacteraeota bacterium]|nr:amidophosphoribosyltransferase [Candidatus Dormibacteraeota bacterium]